MIAARLADRFRGYLPVAVDVETGGFDHRRHALLEIAAVTLTMDEQGVLVPGERLAIAVLPDPNLSIEQSALDFTGIDPHAPERRPEPEPEAMSRIFDLVRRAVREQDCTRAIMVGHNAHFDLGFVNRAAERCNIKRNPFHPFSCFDTATLAGLAFGQTVLARACAAADIPYDSGAAHSAGHDALCTAALFCCIVNRWQALGGWPGRRQNPD
ncbi:MAG: ribonuclease T [Pseudomonadota bacterium]